MRFDNCRRKTGKRRGTQLTLRLIPAILSLLVHSSASAADTTLPPESFMSASVSSIEPYAGEAVIYKLELFTRLKIPLPSLALMADGFTEYVLDETKRTVLHRGIPYNAVILRVLLFPEAPGKVVIPPQAVDLSPYIAVSDEHTHAIEPARSLIKSDAVALEVKPLPTVPAELGNAASQVLIGTTEIKALVDTTPLQIGLTRQLRIVVRSTGNVALLRFNIGTSAGLLAYEGDRDLKVLSTSENPLLEKSFAWTVVPVQKGTVRIRPEGLLIFDPKKRVYEEVPLSPVSFKVTNPPAGSSSQQDKESKEGSSKQVLQYRESNLMERLIERLSLSSALLGICIVLLSAMTVYVHLNVRAWRLRERRYLIFSLREAGDVAALTQAFRHALAEILRDEDERSEGLKELLKKKLGDGELRRSVEAFLQDAATALYSQKQVSIRRLKEMKHKASMLLEEVSATVEDE